MPNSRDKRDPSIVGEKLLSSAKQVRKAYETPGKPITLSEVWDRHTSQFLIPDLADCKTALDRYGDPTEIRPVYAEIRIR